MKRAAMRTYIRRRYEVDGASNAEIARELGVGKGVVSGITFRDGMKTRTQHGNPLRVWTDAMRAQARRLWFDGWSGGLIARRMNVTAGEITWLAWSRDWQRDPAANHRTLPLGRPRPARERRAA